MRRPNKFSAYILKIYPTDDYPSMKLLTFVIFWEMGWTQIKNVFFSLYFLKLFSYFPKKKNHWKNPKNFGYVYLTKYLLPTSITTGRDQA